MIDHMPRPRLPYLQRETDRHGNVRWYIRTSRQSPRVRIESPYGSPGFMEEYRAALDGQKIIREKMARSLAQKTNGYSLTQNPVREFGEKTKQKQ